MITKEELIKYNNTLKLNLGHTEKNYFHTLFLFAVSKTDPNSLIFKGGTCLMICYNLDRFSEDLDFTIISDNFSYEIFFEKIINFLKNYNVISEYKLEQENKYSYRFDMYFYGPLWNNNNQTRCKIQIDISKRKDSSNGNNIIKINHIYNEFPVFYTNCFTIQEIFYEKIRAIIERNKSRDLYDLNYLISRKDIIIDIKEINKKLEIYNKKFDLKEFIKAVNNKKNIWDKEMPLLVKTYPKFEIIKKDVIAFIKERIIETIL
ncbi:MAG: nucleotidyl transferase AbiEii/AbiGii toxin family protein [archaeon]